MAQVLVRNVEDDVVMRLKRQAEREGRSLEQHLRLVLTEAARPSKHELMAELDRIRAMTPGVLDDSTLLIREDRDNDEPYR